MCTLEGDTLYPIIYLLSDVLLPFLLQEKKGYSLWGSFHIVRTKFEDIFI